MSAADDIRDFLVDDLTAFMVAVAPLNLYIYSGQARDPHHTESVHVRVQWLTTDPINRKQKRVRHNYIIHVNVPGQDTLQQNEKAKQVRNYIESIVERYQDQPQRFRATPPNVNCYRSHCFQDTPIDLSENRKTTREIVAALEVDVME